MAYRYLTLSQLGVVSKGQPSYLKHGGKATSEYAQARAAKHAAGQQRGRLIARQREHANEATRHDLNAMVAEMKPERIRAAGNARAASANATSRANSYNTGINDQLAEGTRQAAKAKQIEARASTEYPFKRDPEDVNFQRNKQQQMRRDRQLRVMRSNARAAFPEAKPGAEREKRNLWGPAVGAGLAATAAGGTGYGAYRYHRSWQKPKDRNRQEKQHAI